MIFIAGISNKVKDCGGAEGKCPVCGQEGTLHVSTQYMTPHIFFIPTFRFKQSYLVTCGHCAALMELDKEKGRAVERGFDRSILPGDLTTLRDHSRPACPRCGERPPNGSAFCNRCGEKL